MIIKPKSKMFQYESQVDDTEIIPEKSSEDIVDVVINELTIDKIVSNLMVAKVNFHILHFQTKKFSIHEALGELYETITSKGDDIIECLLGRFNTRISPNIQITCNPLMFEETELNIRDNINLFNNFVEELFVWSNEKNYQDIANLAAELSQLVNKAKYKLSLC